MDWPTIWLGKPAARKGLRAEDAAALEEALLVALGALDELADGDEVDCFGIDDIRGA